MSSATQDQHSDISYKLSSTVDPDKLNKEHTVFVHTDALFDFRAAALRAINPTFVELIKTDMSYYRRDYDIYGDKELGILNKTHLDNICKELLDDIVKDIKPTRINEYVIDYCIEYIQKSKMSPNSQQVQVVLNFGALPFDKELVDLCIYNFENVLSELGVKVSCCDLPIDKCTPQILSAVDTVFIYDYLKYFELYDKSIESGSMVNTHFYVPNSVPVYNGQIDKIDQATRALKELRMTPQMFLKKSVSKHLGMSFVPINMLCEPGMFNNVIIENEIILKNKEKS